MIEFGIKNKIVNMRLILVLIFKAIKKIAYGVSNVVTHILCFLKFYTQNVNFHKFKTNGLPFVSIALGSLCEIGHDFQMNNRLQGNPIGRPQPCIFVVDKGAKLIIGDHVGISSTAIVSHSSIIIGNFVKIGGGVCIYDTDFHSLDPKDRLNPVLDKLKEIKKPIYIEDNVFIGAHSTILKGVTIGRNSIVGACSVVTKSIPPNEIWAGNPAKFIKVIN